MMNSRMEEAMLDKKLWLTLALFAGGRMLWNVGGHIVAAKHGEVVIVPPRVPDFEVQEAFNLTPRGCPVPEEEFTAMLEASPFPGSTVRLEPRLALMELPQPLFTWKQAGWTMDLFRVLPDGGSPVARYRHDSGLVYARAAA